MSVIAVTALIISAASGNVFATEKSGRHSKEKGAYSSYCARCHDMDAEGDGPHHSDLRPPPANLTLARNSKTAMHHIIKNGIPGTGMPAQDISEKEREHILAHIQSQPYSTVFEWSRPWEREEKNVSPRIGERMYLTACHGCHGHGREHGPWARQVSFVPKPALFAERNAEKGRLFHVIKHGRPGTFMAPLKDDLPEAAMWALALYVYDLFDPKGKPAELAQEAKKEQKRNPLATEEGEMPEEAVNAGHEFYNLYCAACHSAQAKGSFLEPNLIDRQWEYGLGRDHDLFTVISHGLPGNLMPAHEALSETERWQVVAYLRHRGGKPDPYTEVIHGH
jgi:mono/diheme cytochrome c family protein